MHTPATDHPHVTEGICTCPEHAVNYGDRTIVVRHASLTCGLSRHRVEAAAAIEIARAAR